MGARRTRRAFIGCGEDSPPLNISGGLYTAGGQSVSADEIARLEPPLYPCQLVREKRRSRGEINHSRRSECPRSCGKTARLKQPYAKRRANRLPYRPPPPMPHAPAHCDDLHTPEKKSRKAVACSSKKVENEKCRALFFICPPPFPILCAFIRNMGGMYAKAGGFNVLKRLV